MSSTHYYMCIVTLYCLLQCVHFSAGDGLVTSTVNNIKDAQNFLRQYGYIPPYLNESAVDELPQEDQDKINSMAIKMYQEYMGLDVTGDLDQNTKEEMAKPRCGHPDVEYEDEKDNVEPGDSDKDIEELENEHGRRRRYTLGGSPWTQRSLTYRITRYTNRLSRSIQDSTMSRALGLWANVSPLRFSRARSSANIYIGFFRGAHGDGYAFDGQNGVLAHAWYPRSRYSGDAHFDDDESWTTGTRGINLMWVATHEFGHSLGMGHSRTRGAVMFPTYSYRGGTVRLHSDDIAGIRRLYGGSGGGLPSGSRCTSNSQCASRRCRTTGWWFWRRRRCT